MGGGVSTLSRTDRTPNPVSQFRSVPLQWVERAVGAAPLWFFRPRVTRAAPKNPTAPSPPKEPIGAPHPPPKIPSAVAGFISMSAGLTAARIERSVMDNPNTDHTRLIADTTGSDFTVPDYAISPEDMPRAEELLNRDPLAVPSPVKLTGSGAFKTPERLTVSILPPEKQAPIAAELARLPADSRAQREHELVTEVLRQNSIELRIKAGPGEGATELDRVQLDVARAIYELEAQEFNIQLQLAEVDKWVPVVNEITGEPVIDPKTGQQQLAEVHAIQGDRRRAMEAEAKNLAYRAGLLRGVEGDRRIQKALQSTIAAEKRTQQQLDDRAEIERLSVEIAREQRIRAQAEILAKRKATEL